MDIMDRTAMTPINKLLKEMREVATGVCLVPRAAKIDENSMFFSDHNKVSLCGCSVLRVLDHVEELQRERDEAKKIGL